VAKGRVLIIEHDEWESALLVKFLKDADYEVEIATEARAGFDRVREFEPDCILCSVNLPDIDGFWVARRVRAEPGRVGATPFLFLTDAEDVESRLQGLNVGADLFLVKPFRAEEVVAQVGALIEMVRRFSTPVAPPSDPAPPSSATPSAIQGDVGQMSLSTVLTLLELERQTGRLKIKGPDAQSAAIELADGAFARGTLDDAPRDAVDLLREILAWKSGRFQFRPTPIQAPSERLSMSGLLLQAMQLTDEASR
jgi:DNA-binding response OmpR family regulator